MAAGKIKIKTNRGAAKRFRVTANGSIKHRSSERNHILTKKNTKRKRKLRTPTALVSANDKKSVYQLLGKR